MPSPLPVAAGPPPLPLCCRRIRSSGGFRIVGMRNEEFVVEEVRTVVGVIFWKHDEDAARSLSPSPNRAFAIQSDAVLDDVSCMLGCTQSSFNVVAAEKGVVVGRLIFNDNGDMIDCTKMGMGGKAIPPNIDRVGDMQSDALFILLVEKDTAYMRFAEDRFYNHFPCIIVTVKGQLDVSTRLFLRKMKPELKLPVLTLVDNNEQWKN